MALTLIKGGYQIIGASPDGDSVKFYPDDPEAFAKAGLRVRTNAKGGAQLRLEGVDALETHYNARVPGGERWRQPSELADAASSALLEKLGFTDVQRDERGTVVASTPERVTGHILTRFADKYGRPVAFAFRGSRRNPDGAKVYLDVDDMRESANFHVLQSGLTYPTFYSLLYVDLRQAMAEAAADARDLASGVWQSDGTLPGFTLRSREQLRDELVILPKLFRRLVDYLSLDESGGVALSGFPAYLDSRDDRLFTVPDGHATEFSTLIEVKRQTVRLTVPPDRIVFREA